MSEVNGVPVQPSDEGRLSRADAQKVLASMEAGHIYELEVPMTGNFHIEVREATQYEVSLAYLAEFSSPMRTAAQWNFNDRAVLGFLMHYGLTLKEVNDE